MSRVGLWERLATAGVSADQTETEKRRIRLLNQTAAIACLAYLAFAAGYARDLAVLWPGAAANVIGAVLSAVVVALSARGSHRAARVLMLLTFNAHMVFMARMMGRAAGFQFYFFPFATAAFVLFPSRRLRIPFAFAALGVALFLGVEVSDTFATSFLATEPMVTRALHIAGVVLAFGTTVLVVYLFQTDALRAEARLASENRRSEDLLLNILPRAISARLKQGETTIADAHEEVTVLFSDLVGFTTLSARLPPGEVVDLLGRIFSRCDDLVDQLGLEKIKTIGDAYMAVGGVPMARPDHAAAATELALGMLDVVAEEGRRSGVSLGVRVGLHTGPVVAGVIGKRKFAFDLWGDTVNTASRMESYGRPGAIHVSAATARHLEGRFDLEPRGTIEVRGKGPMETFWVTRRSTVAAKAS